MLIETKEAPSGTSSGCRFEMEPGGRSVQFERTCLHHTRKMIVAAKMTGGHFCGLRVGAFEERPTTLQGDKNDRRSFLLVEGEVLGERPTTVGLKGAKMTGGHFY